MGDLDRDTAVVGDGGRYTATLSDDWEIWGPNGGYIAAILLRAAGASHRPPGPGLARRPLPRSRRLRRGAAAGTHPAPDPPGRGRRGEHDPGRPGHRRGLAWFVGERSARPRARRDRHAGGRRPGGPADDGRAPARGRHREPVPLLGQHREPAAALAGRLAAARPAAAGVRVLVPLHSPPPPSTTRWSTPPGSSSSSTPWAGPRPRTSTRGSGRPTGRRRGSRRASTSTSASTRRARQRAPLRADGGTARRRRADHHRGAGLVAGRPAPRQRVQPAPVDAGPTRVTEDTVETRAHPRWDTRGVSESVETGGGAAAARPPQLRIGDAERQSVIDQLRIHTGAGRLTLDEFSERADAVWRATTASDLAPLLADLPAPRPDAAPRPRPRTPGRRRPRHPWPRRRPPPYRPRWARPRRCRSPAGARWSRSCPARACGVDGRSPPSCRPSRSGAASRSTCDRRSSARRWSTSGRPC